MQLFGTLESHPAQVGLQHALPPLRANPAEQFEQFVAEPAQAVYQAAQHFAAKTQTGAKNEPLREAGPGGAAKPNGFANLMAASQKQLVQEFGVAAKQPAQLELQHRFPPRSAYPLAQVEHSVADPEHAVHWAAHEGHVVPFRKVPPTQVRQLVGVVQVRHGAVQAA